MTLFENFHQKEQNLLPYDGTVLYYGRFINEETALMYFETLLNTISWQHDEAIVFGKHLYTKREVAWYGDSPFEYTYSKTTKKALPWTDILQKIKIRIEQETSETYNSCLLNLYHNGDEGMSWHSDNESDLKINGAIASLSLGASRNFMFKHKKTAETRTMYLESGSLLVMKDQTQTHWLHRLPTTKKVSSPRINLTFRTIL